MRSKLRPLNPFQEEDLRRQIDDWLQAGVVEPSNGPWASAMVPVKKKGTEKLRWAIDFRKINTLCIRDMFPLAHIDSNLHKLAEADVFVSQNTGCGGGGGGGGAAAAPDPREAEAERHKLQFGLCAAHCAIAEVLMLDIAEYAAAPEPAPSRPWPVCKSLWHLCV